jgi:hypothetical protein
MISAIVNLEVLMTTQFDIERAEPSAIAVRHAAAGHRYLFPIIALEGIERKLSGGEVGFVSKGAQRECAFYASLARDFAEREARRVGLID